MKFEYSALFKLPDYCSDRLDLEIGNGIRVQEIVSTKILSGLVDELQKREHEEFQKLSFRSDHEHYPGWYTHRFFASFEAESTHAEFFGLTQQRIIRAIVLSRIVRPLAIPSVPTVILKSDASLRVITGFGFYSTAYTQRPDYIQRPDYKETLEAGDVAEMAALWSAFENIFNNRSYFVRLHRALHAFNDAYHIEPNHIAHVVLHAALEALICTSERQNQKQVVQRLQSICGIAETEAKGIYHYCCGVKHAAEPALPNTRVSTEVHPEDQKRIAAGRRLDECLRKTFRRALQDKSFAELLEDKENLAKAYPVK